MLDLRVSVFTGTLLANASEGLVARRLKKDGAVSRSIYFYGY